MALAIPWTDPKECGGPLGRSDAMGCGGQASCGDIGFGDAIDIGPILASGD